MRGRLRVAVAALAIALGAGQLAAWSPASAADPIASATNRLKQDATGSLTLQSDPSGVLTFAGVPAGKTVATPGIGPDTGVVAAARAVVERYGAAFGTARSGTGLVVDRAQATVTGDVVRFRQVVGGVPVLGGELVVSLRGDRQLSSILAHTTALSKVPAAAVSRASAAEAAQASFQRSAGHGDEASVESFGRWVVDPQLIGASSRLGVKTAWRFELRRGFAERRFVLVDDQTGRVLMDNDLIQEAKNRVVCDNNSVHQNPALADPYPCVTSTPPDRVEGDPDTANADVDSAYLFGGAVYDNYLAFGGIDLTDMIGRDIGGGTKALAQTVRLCFSGGNPCPFPNAFWNGIQMYYGEGFAAADDVVGHEMTHGVTERTSGLFYWGQSGAMNESISDIMGEIIDHRFFTAGDTPTNWALGEDLPIGAVRNMADPTVLNDPDRTGSPLYVREPCCSYLDEDGVHTNSGVGNKTFYLISQGGTFNGQTITGIDTGDPNLTKSAKLWLLVDQTLSSGSDYADEAAVLEQSCQALIGAGVTTAADCAAVHQATLATELRNTPVNNPQPADATLSCAAGSSVRVLFDSESGTPEAKFTAGAGWSRTGIPGWGENAHSKPASWSHIDSSSAGAVPLVAASPIALPAGQASYLFFQHWRVLEYDGNGFYDAGTVEIDSGTGPADAAGLPWINGPSQPIFVGSGNPSAGRLGFGGDGRGYLASRVDLSSLAGKSVTPRFTLSSDSFNFGPYLVVGWYVDDITVYTCDPLPLPPPTPQPSAATSVKVKGKLFKAVVKWQPPATNPAAVTGYRVTTTGKTVTVGAGATKAVVKGLKQGKTYAFTVSPLGAAGFVGPSSTVSAKGTKTTLKVEGAAGSTGLRGKLLQGSKGLKGKVLKVLTKKLGKWVKIAQVTTGKKGKYQLLLKGTSTRPYRVQFMGALGLMGSRSPKRHL